MSLKADHSVLSARSIPPDPIPFGKQAAVHQHAEIEIIAYEHGPAALFCGGRKVVISIGEMAVFWGAMPHQAIEAEPQVIAHVVRVPLPTVLQWPLPTWFVRRLMNFDVLIEPPSCQPCPDLDLLKHWVQLARRGTADADRILLLEVEARLCRMALDRREVSHGPTMHHAGAGRIDRMVAAIAQRCLGPLHVSDIAREAGLTRAYATRLFHRETGVTMQEYITRQRVSHAQRLLATSRRCVLDVLQECGFRSPTRFYAVFRRFAGGTPGQYRRQLQISDVCSARVRHRPSAPKPSARGRSPGRQKPVSTRSTCRT